MILNLLYLLGCAYYPNYRVYSFELTEKEKTEIINAHNQWRKQVGVPNLVWSKELEKIAQNWANKLAKNYSCRMIHSSNRLGENIFWSNSPVRPKYVVDYWAQERFNYDYYSNSCRQDKICSHYTQIIWRETKELGCARALCSKGEEIWVCNYNPAGNIVGKKPY
nr:CAP domain-containing protein [Thermodesulfovibrio sp. N1]